MVNFALAGKKTFHFSDNLAEHLANTEINLKAALIQLPLPTCLFTFTSRAVIHAMHNIRGDDGRWAMNVVGLQQDFAAKVLTDNLHALIAIPEADEMSRPNRTELISAIKPFLVASLMRIRPDPEALNNTLDAIIRNRCRIQPDRHYPRPKKPKPHMHLAYRMA